MTEQPNPGSSQGDDSPTQSFPQPPAAPPPPDVLGATRTDQELGTPPVEPADSGPAAPAHLVARDGAAAAAAPAGRGRSGVRWAIALGGVALVVGVTVAILALAAGRPSPSVAVGYMPAETLSYGEYRLDLPGDQRTKMAAFLSKFPGFADQANVQTKLYEVFDRIVGAITDNDMTYTADIEPWFGGQIATGSGAGTAGSSMATPFLGMGGGMPLVVVTVKDQAKATAWVKSTIGDSLVETPYNGTTIYGTDGSSDAGLIVTGEVILIGSTAGVQAAFDSNGDGKLADDDQFKAAFSTVNRDYVSFSYTEYRALIQSLVSTADSSGSLASTTIDEELVSLVPEWQASVFRFEDDALVGDSTYPSVDVGFDAQNKKSSLIGHAPRNTLFYGETHDIGPAALAVVEKLRGMPELREAFGEIDSTIGAVGGFDGLVGWMGDGAVLVTKMPDGSIGGGLLIQPTDAEDASRTFEMLRSLIVLGGGGMGIELRDVDHGGQTITVIDLSGAAGGAGLPEGVKAELAYAVTDDVIVIGYGEAFVAEALDADEAESLADDGRFGDLADRAGAENIGFAFVDVEAIRALVEPLAEGEMPPDQWAFYEREIQPYLLPFDALISSIRVDGDNNRVMQLITVE